VGAVQDFTSTVPNLARDVSALGVRFYSLCGTCGDRMEFSATLCDDCARKRSGFSSNY
jgi:predicted amidophosphoribosyltransferase